MTTTTTLVIIALAVSAQSDAEDALKKLRKSEPPIEAVQRAALDHFGVHPDRVSGMRAGAAWKAAIPTLEVSGGATGATINDTTILDEYDPVTPWVVRGASGNALE